MPDFLPSTEGALYVFYDLQAIQLPEQGPTLNLAAAQVAATEAACREARDAILAADSARRAAAAAVSEKNAKIATANTLVRLCASQGKLSTTYTKAIGARMNWIASNPPLDSNTYKAVIRSVINPTPGRVELKFAKAGGKIVGVNVYMRRQGETPWTPLGLAASSPYVDKTPLATPSVPDVREYRIRGVAHGVEIGEYSDACLVVTT